LGNPTQTRGSRIPPGLQFTKSYTCEYSTVHNHHQSYYKMRQEGRNGTVSVDLFRPHVSYVKPLLSERFCLPNFGSFSPGQELSVTEPNCESIFKRLSDNLFRSLLCIQIYTEMPKLFVRSSNEVGVEFIRSLNRYICRHCTTAVKITTASEFDCTY